MPPRANQQRYRRVTIADNPTQYNRVTAPVGTFLPTPARNPYQPLINNGGWQTPYSNPSTATNGQQGAPYAMTPARPPTGSFSGWNSANAAQQNRAQTATQGPYLGQGVYLGGATSRPPAPSQSLARGMPLSSSSMYGGIEYTQGMLSSGQLPGTLTSFQLQQLQASGMDTSTLSAYYQPNGQGGYTLNAQGIQNNTGAQTQTPATPVQPQGGAAPFGYNAAGERLDASGNAWNPATATRDIYGGAFVQEGATRWTRDSRGRVVRQVASDGRWRNQNRRRPGAPHAGNPSPVSPVSEPQLATGGASAFISFNTATG